jgi:hypothetical protein
VSGVSIIIGWNRRPVPIKREPLLVTQSGTDRSFGSGVIDVLTAIGGSRKRGGVCRIVE